MRWLATCLAIAMLAGSCRQVTLGELGIDPSAPPEQKEYKGVRKYEEKEIPGYRYYYRAAVAYADYMNLVHEQEELKNPIGREGVTIIPQEEIERKKRKHLDDARNNLEKMFELNTEFAKAYMVMGLVRLACDEYDEAVASFREVLRIDPLAGNAWVNIAHARWRQGDAPKAKEAIAEVLKMNPSNRPALQLREIIEEEESRKAREDMKEGVPPFRPKLDRK